MESKAAGGERGVKATKTKRHIVVNAWLNVIRKFSTDSYVYLFCRNAGFINYF